MQVHFIGGAGTVTGSKLLLETNGTRILIDCGLYQGLKALRELNWQPLPFLPETIDCVLLTHGHLDHCGWLPCLVDQGFTGKIYCSGPTKEVARLVLLDSAKIQQEEAEKANAGKYSKHDPAKPLYTEMQAKSVFPHFHIVEPNTEIAIPEGITVRFFPAGHIIGACSISVKAEGKTLVFSGDIGQDEDNLMFPPQKPTQADYVFMESTYGNRQHPKSDTALELDTYINNAFRVYGTVIIPGFAVERAQSILYEIWQLRLQGRLPDIPYILDTPMGTRVLNIFKENSKWHKLSPKDCEAMFDSFRIITDYAETLETIRAEQRKVVIAASGMLTGGRVLSYLEHYIGHPKCTILFSGYQAEGTRGRKLLEGAAEVKIFGRYLPVKAKILAIEGLSAHADQNGLVGWLSELKEKPRCVYLVHGENQATDALRTKIQERYGYECHVALMGSQLEI